MIRLIDILKQHIASVDKAIIAIDGPAGSGKSSLANILRDRFNATLFHLDDFFLPEAKKTKTRLQEVGGNVDYERFENKVLKHLDDRIIYQPFDCKTQSITSPIIEDELDVVIVEGSYSMHERLFPYYTFTILLKVDKEEQYKRLKARTNINLFQRFVNEFIPLENEYFKARNLEKKVDVIMNFNTEIMKNML